MKFVALSGFVNHLVKSEGRRDQRELRRSRREERIRDVVYLLPEENVAATPACPIYDEDLEMLLEECYKTNLMAN